MHIKRFVVEYVYWDEATPRTAHYRAVYAVDADDATMIVVADAHLDGDRVGVIGVLTDSRH